MAKSNSFQQNRCRTQGRENLQNALERIRQAANSDKRQKFTSLWHHVYHIDRLREEYFNLKRKSAAGVDGQTWVGFTASWTYIFPVFGLSGNNISQMLYVLGFEAISMDLTYYDQRDETGIAVMFFANGITSCPV